MAKSSSSTGSSSLILMLMVLVQQVITSKCTTDSEILLQFRKSLGNSSALSNWDDSKPPCSNNKANWVGLLCQGGSIWGLKLENIGLNGKIDVDTLVDSKSLRSISLMHNNFEGPLPDIKKLGALKTLYLSNNKFSGEIPSNAFEGMHSIKKIHLASNNFSGPIPGSLTTLQKLIELMLQDNEFEGEIPEFPQKYLETVNFANNHLQGHIPATLSNLNESSFSGNQDLCGPPLKGCDGYSPPSSSSKLKLSVGTIVIIAIASIAALAALIAALVFILLRHCQQRKETTQENQEPSLITTSTTTDAPPAAAASSNLDIMEKGMSQEQEAEASNTNNRKSGHLIFLQESREKFDMSDLLKATAEILGSSSSSGVFGSSCYKAALPSPADHVDVVVVKRYRQMNNVSKQEFHQHMTRLGNLTLHPNLLPLVAFYYRKEEKLLIADYVHNGSLSFHLHGNKSSCPDWATRLKIVKGVAKGLCSLYNSLPNLIAPHGHLKSTNVLLTENFDPLLTDYGLLPVVNSDHAREQMIAYKSPEFKLNGRITKKTDVWSLGILILEMLTGKFPSYNEADDMSTWVLSSMLQIKEEADQVLDKQMRGTQNCEGEIIKLLHIALSCCQVEIDKRLDIREAMEKIQEIKERDDTIATTITILDQRDENNNNNNNINDDFYSSFGSEVDVRSSRGLSTDFDLNAG